MAKEKEKKRKAKYGMMKIIPWTLKVAWDKQKAVIFIILITVTAQLVQNLAGLYLSPSVLSCIEQEKPLSTLIVTIAAFALTTALCGAVLNYLNWSSMFRFVDIRSRFMSIHMKSYLTTSVSNTENDDYTDLFRRSSGAMDNNNAAAEDIYRTYGEILKNIIGFIIYLALIANVNPVLAVVVVVTCVLNFFVGNKFNDWDYRRRDEVNEYYNKINYHNRTGQNFSFAKDIRLFNMKEWLDELYDKNMNLLRNFNKKREMVFFWRDFIDVALTFSRNGVAYIYLISSALGGGLSASEFLLCFSAVGGFAGWVSGILGIFSRLRSQAMDMSDVREFIEYPSGIVQDPNPLPIPDLPDGEYSIELKNVSYRYSKADHNTLSGINLTIHAGEKLAVVGMNGEGKTTLIKLICGFYDPTEGEVLLNGINIKKFNRLEYYRKFTAVFQTSSILPTDIAENIYQDDPNPDTDKMNECIRLAGLEEKIKSLPDGLNTHYTKELYNDGILLSGGEQQRLMLARALYRNSPIMVLDEPTSALDPLAEADMYERYNSLCKNKTSVFISHRLASTRFCDRIILLSGGKIAEEGTHASLLAKNGIYTELFNTQAKYYSSTPIVDN